MKRQLTLFGTRAKEKTGHFVVYKNPRGLCESYVEIYCLTAKKRNPHSKKKDIFVEAQTEWNKISSDINAVEEFLKLKEDEKDFVR